MQQASKKESGQIIILQRAILVTSFSPILILTWTLSNGIKIKPKHKTKHKCKNTPSVTSHAFPRTHPHRQKTP